MSWEPSFPLTAAERHVDFPAHETHIYERRNATERACHRLVARLAASVALNGLPAQPLLVALAARLALSLAATASFGYREAQREIRQLRAQHGEPPVTAAYAIPDAGQYTAVAQGGLEAVRRFLRYRADHTAAAIAVKAIEAFAAAASHHDRVLLARAITDVADRSLHNHVLELVGETLNLGRTAGALKMERPPEFAMRSEQLDKRMCEPCGTLHGQIAQVGSQDFYSLSPPNGCLGGGRCRGLWVYGDSPAQMTLRPAA